MEIRWYYSLLGEEFGPVGTDHLQELIGQQVLLADDTIRRESDGRRFPVWSLPELSISLAETSPAEAPASSQADDEHRSETRCDRAPNRPHPVPRRLNDRRSRATLPAEIRRAAVVAAVVALTGVVGWQMVRPDPVPRIALATLTEIDGRIHNLRIRNAPAEEWSKLADSCEAEVTQLVAELEHRASPESPADLQLLRASRDHLPIALNHTPRTKAKAQVAHEDFRRCLDYSRAILAGGTHPERTDAPGTEWGLYAAIGCSGAIWLCLGIWAVRSGADS